MENKIYHGEFTSWADVANTFGGYNWSNTEKPPSIAEPEEVLFAGYDQPGYEGYATVLYRQGDKFYSVEGSHCSCFGLEGQWKPEEYESKDLLVAALKREGSWDWRNYGRAMLQALGETIPEKEAR